MALVAKSFYATCLALPTTPTTYAWRNWRN